MKSRCEQKAELRKVQRPLYPSSFPEHSRHPKQEKTNISEHWIVLTFVNIEGRESDSRNMISGFDE